MIDAPERSTAEDVYDYMVFRAEREKQPHTLTLAFYQAQWTAGVRSFFGVKADEYGIFDDTQQPRLLWDWLTRGMRS